MAEPKVFIVHGSNNNIKNEIDIFLRNLGLQTIVMDAVAHQGRTASEKFEELASESSFAVFILAANDELLQNVMLQAGYFWGALGRRGNVALLIDPEVEIPPAIEGIGHIPITEDLGNTKLELGRELEAAGLLGGNAQNTPATNKESWQSKQLDEYHKLIVEIDYALSYYAPAYSNPGLSNEKDTEEAQKELRRLASKLKASFNAIPSELRIEENLPSEENVLNASGKIRQLMHAVSDKQFLTEKGIEITSENPRTIRRLLLINDTAASEVEQTPNPDVFEPLIRQLKDPNKRHDACKTLIKFGVPAVPWLIKALQNEEWNPLNWKFGWYVADALGRIGDPAAVPALIEVLDNENVLVRVRGYVASALQKIGTPEALEAMEKWRKAQSTESEANEVDSVEDADDSENPHVFISHVSENETQVYRLAEDLRKHGVKVWLNRDDIKPGSRWQYAIEAAIEEGSFFIACFSKEYNERNETYMNEELTLAIEKLRKRPHNHTWFIPVVFSSEVPDRNIGAGETLHSLQWVELNDANWEDGIQRIVDVAKPGENAEVIQKIQTLERIQEILKSTDFEWPQNAALTAINFSFWNKGRKPIKRENIIEKIHIILDDPEGVIVEVRLLKVPREFTNVTLNFSTYNPKRTIDIDFRILERNDGATGQIIYAGNPESNLHIGGIIEGNQFSSIGFRLIDRVKILDSIDILGDIRVTR